MKTKKVTKQRNQARDFDVAMLDCADEFGSVLLDDILDEEALAELDEDWDE